MTMSGRNIVLDTSVLYAGLYSRNGASHQILQSVERGDIRLALSTALVLEYEEVLRRDQRVLGLSDASLRDVLDGLCRHGEPHAVHFLWRPFLPDPNDDHVLELAVAANASVVTRNVRHFPNTSSFGVKILTPGQLLEALP